VEREAAFFGIPLASARVGVMNVRLVEAEKRDYFLECVKEGAGLDVCAVVDTGLTKAGNVAMEQVAARKGMVWIGKGRKRRSGGLGFLVVGEWKVESLKWVVDSVGWIQVSNKSVKLVVGAVYRAPSVNLGDTLAGITGDVMRYRGRGIIVWWETSIVGLVRCRTVSSWRERKRRRSESFGGIQKIRKLPGKGNSLWRV